MTLLPPLLPLRDRLPTRLFPFVNYAFIVANVVVFIAQRIAVDDDVSEAITRTWGLVPHRLFVNPAVGAETALTSMFMHEGLSHLGGNMLFLWIFGDNVEDAMGHVRYAVFYIVGGVCAAAAQTLIDPMSLVPMIGASGAISAVLAAYVFLYPRSAITVLNPIFILWFFFGLFLHLPAWLVIGEFFVTNLFSALGNHVQGGVAFMAHVGGFIGGAVLFRAFVFGRPRVDEYARWERWARRRQRGDTWW